jgi:hypothetical protein
MVVSVAMMNLVYWMLYQIGTFVAGAKYLQYRAKEKLVKWPVAP